MTLLFAQLRAEANEEKAVSVVLSSMLKHLSSGDWAALYLLYDDQTKKVQLGDAVMRLRVAERAGDAKSREATAIFSRYYDKKAAIQEFDKTEKSLTEPEKILLQMRHIASPEKFYADYHVFRDARPYGDDIAALDDFKITINGGNASAAGKGGLVVNFVKEGDAWKVMEGWRVVPKENE